MVLDVVRVEKGRWQDDHILIIGYLATLKGDQMKNRNVQIPYELLKINVAIFPDGEL